MRNNLNNLTPLQHCQRSLYALGVTVLGYEDGVTDAHKEMCKFIEGPETRKLLIGARGIYKTSFCTIGRAIQLVIQDPNNRILVVQNTVDNARLTVGEIKDHFEQNPLLRKIAGHLVPKNTQKIPWSNSALLLNRSAIFSEPTITAAGVDTQVSSEYSWEPDVLLFSEAMGSVQNDPLSRQL